MHLIKSIPNARQVTSTPWHPAARKLAISTQDGLMLVRWQEITRCMADSNYARIHLVNGSVLVVCKPLGHVQKALPSKQFIRVHQSHLISLEAIRVVGRDEVILEADIHIPISRSGRKLLMERIQQTSEQL